MVRPAYAGMVVLAGAIGATAAFVGLAIPAAAAVLLLCAQFFRLPLTGLLPADPFLLAFAGMLAAGAVAYWRRRTAPARLGPLGIVMVLYVLWNIGSWLATHEFAAVEPTSGQVISVWRFVLTGTVIPFAMFVVGRYVLTGTAAVRAVLWMLVVLTAYSAATAVFLIYGPAALVWPRYLLSVDTWPGRAVGIFNQPVVNGLVLIIGFLAAVVVATTPGPRLARWFAGAVAVGAVVGIYLTHTRAVWLSFVVVLVAGIVLAKGFRLAFGATLGTAVLFVILNWAEFTSADRAAGGVASAGELEDRLNTIATSFWAIEQKPLFGWGIARFAAINTYHHQQWSPDTPWIRGYGIVSHFNELGIAAELGIIGVAIWLAVVVLLAVRVLTALRRVREPGVLGRPTVFLAASSLVVLVITGVTVDLRYFDFPNTLVMLIVGMAVGIADRLRPAPSPPPGHDVLDPPTTQLPRVEVPA
jgi:O-antigen ligase